MRTCSAIRKDGQRCQSWTIEGSEWCMAHHPDKATDRVRYGKRGAKVSGRSKIATELKHLYERVEKLAEMVHSGEMDRSTASVIGQLHNISRAILRDLLQAREQEELIARLEDLERKLEQSQKQQGRGRRPA